MSGPFEGKLRWGRQQTRDAFHQQAMMIQEYEDQIYSLKRELKEQTKKAEDAKDAFILQQQKIAEFTLETLNVERESAQQREGALHERLSEAIKTFGVAFRGGEEPLISLGLSEEAKGIIKENIGPLVNFFVDLLQKVTRKPTRVRIIREPTPVKPEEPRRDVPEEKTPIKEVIKEIHDKSFMLLVPSLEEGFRLCREKAVSPIEFIEEYMVPDFKTLYYNTFVDPQTSVDMDAFISFIEEKESELFLNEGKKWLIHFHHVFVNNYKNEE